MYPCIAPLHYRCAPNNEAYTTKKTQKQQTGAYAARKTQQQIPTNNKQAPTQQGNPNNESLTTGAYTTMKPQQPRTPKNNRRLVSSPLNIISRSFLTVVLPTPRCSLPRLGQRPPTGAGGEGGGLSPGPSNRRRTASLQACISSYHLCTTIKYGGIIILYIRCMILRSRYTVERRGKRKTAVSCCALPIHGVLHHACKRTVM